MSQRTRLAIFAMFPPTPSGIADYCRELLPYWSRHFDALYVLADDAPEPHDLPAGTSTMRYGEFLKRPDASALPCWYQMGNNRLHTFMQRAIVQRPGILTLHDFVMSHSLLNARLPADDAASYEARMRAAHGKGGAAIARLLERNVYCWDDPFRFPLNGWLLERTSGVIVHSREARRRIEYEHPGLPVRHIPHHALDVEPASDDDAARAAARSRLGLPPNKFLLISLGFATKPKQNDFVLAALGKIRDRLPPFEFHQIGLMQDEFHIFPAIAENRLQAYFRSSGYVTLEQMHDYILACDAVVNLRYPSGLETSGTLLRAMTLGRPAVIFNYDSFSDYPDSAAIKLPLDTFDTTNLEAALLKLAYEPDYRRRIGAAAAAYVRRHHAIEHCAAAHAEFIGEVLRRGDHRPAQNADGAAI